MNTSMYIVLLWVGAINYRINYATNLGPTLLRHLVIFLSFTKARKYIDWCGKNEGRCDDDWLTDEYFLWQQEICGFTRKFVFAQHVLEVAPIYVQNTIANIIQKSKKIIADPQIDWYRFLWSRAWFPTRQKHLSCCATHFKITKNRLALS